MPSGITPLPLSRADCGAEIGLLAEAAFALPAFRRVERDDVVARLHRGHARTDLANDAGALMAQDRREDSFAVEAVERVGVGVADARRLDLDQDFADLRSFQIDLHYLERLLGFESDGGTCLHRKLLKF
ncbi:hypothetical protein ACVWW5_002851 [Bradyrhizobium sp. LM3.4]